MSKKKISDFNYFDDTESQNYLAAHWPKGLLTSKRYVSDSILYKLIKVLAIIIKIFTGQISTVAKNTDIAKADELLTEWEASAKIPELIPRRNTIEGRREAAERMISRIPVYNVQGKRAVDIDTTIEEFVRKTTGIEIEIEMLSDRPSTSAFTLTFPITFDYSDCTRESIFIIKVQAVGSAQNNIFTMTFPISFDDPAVPQATIDLLDRALERVIPSYATWIYEVIPAT